MVHETLAEEFYRDHAGLALIDVRSPVEYNKGHIPGANNIFLFNDDERALLGFLYTKRSPDEAIQKGMELANSRLEQYVEAAIALAPAKVVRVYCWRGGMRSHSFAELLSSNGFEVYLLTGGYKDYRNMILTAFTKELPIIVLGGMTGSGKTDMLHYLAKKDIQLIDLEGLAHHKGSVFGGVNEHKQPLTQQFENDLFEVWSTLDSSKAVLVEDENFSIGSVRLPLSLWQQIRQAPLIHLQIPRELRLQNILSVYAGQQDELLIEGAQRLERRLGNELSRKAEQSIRDKNYRIAAEILLDYYDKSYLASIAKRNPDSIFEISLEGKQNREEIDSLISCIEDIYKIRYGSNDF